MNTTAQRPTASQEPDPATCANCSKPIDTGSRAFDGLYVDAQGGQHPHYLCNRCGARAIRDPKFHEQMAGRIELLLAPAEGRS